MADMLAQAMSRSNGTVVRKCIPAVRTAYLHRCNPLSKFWLQNCRTLPPNLDVLELAMHDQPAWSQTAAWHAVARSNDPWPPAHAPQGHAVTNQLEYLCTWTLHGVEPLTMNVPGFSAF